ncbi:MAG: hypothetical protein OEM82_15180 [Acidobacteriota bacterium]|nr:hypothetical protein [Acidobacteriota bacterium]MDH3530139.1 hypothetical protein [Acidobacteriota bacterium]
MLKEAVGYYHELLEDEELSRKSVEQLASKMEEARLIFGGRRLSPYLRPHFVTESDWNRTAEICDTIFGTLQKVRDAAVESEELLNELGVTEAEKRLIEPDPGYQQAAATARLDSFLTEDSYSYVELNGESPAGIAFSDSARDIFLDLPVVRRFSEKYEIYGLEGRSRLLSTLLNCYEQFLGKPPESKPVIGIVDLKGLPTVQEFELCKEYFESNGYPAIICSPDELEFDGESLKVNGRKLDIVYRRLLVREYLPIIDQYPALFDAYKAGAVCVANSYQSLLLHKKALFAVMTDERFAHLFDEAELAAIRRYVPWTRNFREEKTRFYDQDIDLIEWTRENRDKLVLKPNDDYGGHGIYIGWASDESEWNAAIEHALKTGDYLVQERVKTAKEPFPYVHEDGTVEMVTSMVDLDPLMFSGKTGSAFTRLSTSELANVSSGGGMVPTIIIRGKKQT